MKQIEPDSLHEALRTLGGATFLENDSSGGLDKILSFIASCYRQWPAPTLPMTAQLATENDDRQYRVILPSESPPLAKAANVESWISIGLWEDKPQQNTSSNLQLDSPSSPQFLPELNVCLRKTFSADDCREQVIDLCLETLHYLCANLLQTAVYFEVTSDGSTKGWLYFKEDRLYDKGLVREWQCTQIGTHFTPDDLTWTTQVTQLIRSLQRLTSTEPGRRVRRSWAAPKKTYWEQVIEPLWREEDLGATLGPISREGEPAPSSLFLTKASDSRSSVAFLFEPFFEPDIAEQCDDQFRAEDSAILLAAGQDPEDKTSYHITYTFFAPHNSARQACLCGAHYPRHETEDGRIQQLRQPAEEWVKEQYAKGRPAVDHVSWGLLSSPHLYILGDPVTFIDTWQNGQRRLDPGIVKEWKKIMGRIRALYVSRPLRVGRRSASL